MSVMVAPYALFGTYTGEPFFVAEGTLYQQSSATTLTPAYPVGIQANDIGLLHVHFNSAITPRTISSVSGSFTLIPECEHLSDGNQDAAALYWKRLTGSESGTESVTLSGATSLGVASAIITVWRGCALSGNPYEAPAKNAQAATTNHVGSAITTLGPRRRVVSVFGLSGANAGAPNGDWDEEWEHFTTSGNDGTINGNSLEVMSAGLVAAISRTIASSRNVSFTVALIPVPIAPSFTVNPSIIAPSAPYGVGDTLEGAAGTHDGTSTSYSWERDGVAIGGATSINYLVDAADLGADLRLRVTATNAVGSVNALSNSTGTILAPDTWDIDTIKWDEE